MDIPKIQTSPDFYINDIGDNPAKYALIILLAVAFVYFLLHFL